MQSAFKNRPELEQAALTLRNDEITLKGARNALLPALDAYGFYGSSALGGSQNPDWVNFGTGQPYPPGTLPSTGYGTVLTNLYNGSAPDKGVGFTLNIPIRNRQAQSVQARSLMEYRQAELRLAQLYTQIRMQVVNAQFALTNDRAEVQASLAARDYARQSLDAEQKKLHLGASTTANVLLQERNLATAENNLIAAQCVLCERASKPLPDAGYDSAAIWDQPLGCGKGHGEYGTDGSRSTAGECTACSNSFRDASPADDSAIKQVTWLNCTKARRKPGLCFRAGFWSAYLA